MPLQTLKPTIAPLILRLGLAAILFYHGLIKVMDHDGKNWLKPELEVPAQVQMAVAYTEVVSAGLIAVGLLTRLAALAVVIIQAGAIYFITWNKGFVSLQSLQPGGLGYRYEAVGWEYNFAMIVMALTLVLLGSGTWSLNNIFLGMMGYGREHVETAATV